MRNHERGVGARIGSASTPAYDDFASPPVLPGVGGARPRSSSTAAAQRTFRLSPAAPSIAPRRDSLGLLLTCEEIQVRAHARCARPSLRVRGAVAAARARAARRRSWPWVHETRGCRRRCPHGYVYLTETTTLGFFRFRPRDTSRRFGALEAAHARDAQVKVPTIWISAPRCRPAPRRRVVAIAEPNADPERLETLVAGLPPIFGGASRAGYPGARVAQRRRVSQARRCCTTRLVYFTDTTVRREAARYGARPDAHPAMRVRFSELPCRSSRQPLLQPAGGSCCATRWSGRVARVASLDRLQSGFAYPFAENNMLVDAAVRAALDCRRTIAPEVRGARSFAPRDYLFVNVQVPGVTFAFSPSAPLRARGDAAA